MSWEFQAEAVALLLARELDVPGFNEADSRGYIQGWLGAGSTDFIDTDEAGEVALVEDSTINAIFNAVDKILVAGRKAHYEELKASEEATA